MIDAKEKTALATSVGADERQSFQTSSANIIPTSDTEINHPDEKSSENLEEIYRQMQIMNDPAYGSSTMRKQSFGKPLPTLCWKRSPL